MQAQRTFTGTVQFTRGPLGTIAHPDASFFEDEVVNKGDRGEYLGPHQNDRLAADDWHMVKVIAGGRDRYVPVHSSQIEQVER